jgi:phosphate transport system permease protein
MMDLVIYKRRKTKNIIGLFLSNFAMLLGIAALLWILFVLFYNGFAAIDFNFFVNGTPAAGSPNGGLANAIIGSLMIVGITTLLSTPAGILAGIYLSEYSGGNIFGSITRFISDIMLSAPSIVIGLFVYAVYVSKVRHYSGYAGAFALSLIAIPVILRTTENMLRLIPAQLREAAFALGAPKWRVSINIVLRAARNGVLTGLLLAIARVSGETAPLLFTALSNQYFTSSLNKPTANLPVVIYQFALSPYKNWISLAWGGALLITLTVLLLNIIARVFLKENKTA